MKKKQLSKVNLIEYFNTFTQIKTAHLDNKYNVAGIPNNVVRKCFIVLATASSCTAHASDLAVLHSGVRLWGDAIKLVHLDTNGYFRELPDFGPNHEGIVPQLERALQWRRNLAQIHRNAQAQALAVTNALRAGQGLPPLPPREPVLPPSHPCTPFERSDFMFLIKPSTCTQTWFFNNHVALLNLDAPKWAKPDDFRQWVRRNAQNIPQKRISRDVIIHRTLTIQFFMFL